MINWVKLLGGILMMVVGIWQLSEMIEDTRKGYKDAYGNDIKIYFGSIGCIILGLILIWQELF